MDPLNPQVAPVPSSPAGVPGIPDASAAGPLSQEQMRANLQEVQGKLQDSFSGFNKQVKMNDISSKEQASELLRQLFDMLQSQGVDPNSPEAVKAFLDQMKESNPERYQHIVQALQMIMSGDTEAPAMPPEGGAAPAAEPVAPLEGNPSGNMNIQNESAPQNV